MNDLYHFFDDVLEKSTSEIIKKEQVSIDTVDKFTKSKYISKNAKKAIHKFKKGSCYTFEEYDLDVCIFGEEDKIPKILKTIRFMLTLNGSCNKLQTIVIFLTPLKKELALEFTPDNINSGLTNGKYICIFREEEVVKVCIHELIHALNWDFGADEEIVQKHLNHLIKSNGDFSLSEAYTEAWAKIINCYLCSDDIEGFHSNYEKEKIFTLWQMSKVIENSKDKEFNTLSEFVHSVDKETHVFSYYILAPAMIFDIERFIRLCKKYNREYVIYDGEPSEYSKYILESMTDPEFLKSLKSMISIYKKNKDKKEFLEITMRMTIIEC